jgi:hypothetical protein
MDNISKRIRTRCNKVPAALDNQECPAQMYLCQLIWNPVDDQTEYRYDIGDLMRITLTEHR